MQVAVEVQRSGAAARFDAVAHDVADEVDVGVGGHARAIGETRAERPEPAAERHELGIGGGRGVVAEDQHQMLVQRGLQFGVQRVVGHAGAVDPRDERADAPRARPRVS